MKMFSSSTYITRRESLRSRIDSGLVLLLGHHESPMNYTDNAYSFRQNSSFLYYIGLDQPDLAAIIDVDEGSIIVFGDELSIDHIVWMGDLPTIAERATAVGVTEIRPSDDLKTVIGQALSGDRKIHYLPPYRADNIFDIMDLVQQDRRTVMNGSSLELIQAVVAQRSIKSAEEIAEIEQAVNISVDMHIAAMRIARPGMLESEVAAEVEKVALAAGGRTSFPVIATIHGETLHNHFHGNRIASGDLFLLDAGAENAMHYAGDLSSTFPIDSKFTDRQKSIYTIALAAYDAAVAKLAPGVPNRTVHLTAARVIAEGMEDLGVMKGNLDDAINEGAHAMFFPCGVGHMMGLDVHDMEDLGEVWVGYDGQPKSTQFGLKSLRLARPLEPGFVITVEPGIYFIPQLMDLWRSQNLFTEFLDYDRLDQWRNFGGIRNEEDYLITETGARRLGKAKPTTIDEIEDLRRG